MAIIFTEVVKRRVHHGATAAMLEIACFGGKSLTFSSACSVAKVEFSEVLKSNMYLLPTSTYQPNKYTY